MPESTVLTVMKKMMSDEPKMECVDSTMRESIDANVILRYILRDSEAQYRRVAELLADGMKQLYVEDIAIAEVIYVLTGKVYQVGRREAVSCIRNFLEIPSVVCNNRDLVLDTLGLYETCPKLSFADCYLTVMANMKLAEPLWTFDKVLARQTRGAKLL